MVLMRVEPTTAQSSAIRRQLASMASYATTSSCTPAIRSICNFQGADEDADRLWQLPWGHNKLSLRQLLQGSAKLHRLHKLLRQRITEGAQLLIFTSHWSSRRLLSTYFDFLAGLREDSEVDAGDREEYDLTHLTELLCTPLASICDSLDGDDCSDEAAAALENFDKGTTRILHLSTDAGGRGHNAPAADDVIFFDGCRSARAWEQCTFRPLRLGRKASKRLTVYDLVLADTLEEGERTARWARAALADVLLPSWLDQQAGWMGSGANGRRTEKRAVELLERGVACVSGALTQLSQQCCQRGLGNPSSRRLARTSSTSVGISWTPSSAKDEAWHKLQCACTTGSQRARKVLRERVRALTRSCPPQDTASVWLFRRQWFRLLRAAAPRRVGSSQRAAGTVGRRGAMLASIGDPP